MFGKINKKHIKKWEELKSVEKLIRALEYEKDSDIREAAARALGKIKDPRAVKPLISALKNDDYSIRKAAAEALGEIKDPRAEKGLIPALKDKISDVRSAVAYALEKINPNWRESEEAKERVPEFICAMEDENSNVSKAAVNVLIEIKDPRAVEAFISALKRDNRYSPDAAAKARRIAAEALGKIKDPRAVKPLISALEDDYSFVSRAAAEALGKIKDSEALGGLISSLKDTFATGAVIEALEKINPDWRESEEAKVKVPEFVSVLLWSKHPGVRRNIAYVLGEIKDSQAVKPLLSALERKDSDVRKNVAFALGKIKDPRAVKPLISALEDEDSTVRRAAAEALGEIKDSRAVKPLISALEDEDSDVREVAEKALEEINPDWRKSKETKE